MKKADERKHFAFVAGFPCSECGSSPVQVAHVRHLPGITKGRGGIGFKPHCAFTIPLCWECHGKQHALGSESEFGRQEGINMLEIALGLAGRSPVQAVREFVEDLREHGET